jgi:hypothetical protein
MVNKRTYLFGTILSIIGLLVADEATTKLAFVALGGFLAVAYTFNKDRE